MRKIVISKHLSLPIDTVTQAIAILARRGSGKSYLTRRIVEQLFGSKQQVVIADPKGDWWGVRSSADGKKAGMPIIILGGEHGDIPLESNSGEIVAKLAVHERVSVLLDLSSFRKNEVATFMTAFLENFYRLKAKEKYRTPVMLVIDEADAIAPQRPMKGQERMLGAAEDIVRRGRQRGIGCLMATQRSAVLNKNVLTQCEMMVSMRTIAPQDLKAMNEWIDVHGTIEQQKILMESLPSLPTGDAWFWSPAWPTSKGIFVRTRSLLIETFDSFKTPEAGKTQIVPRNMADIDLSALSKQMSDTIERAKADDPKELKREISELKRVLKSTAEIKTETKFVEIPILKDDEINRLDNIVADLSVIADGIAAIVDVANKLRLSADAISTTVRTAKNIQHSTRVTTIVSPVKFKKQSIQPAKKTVYKSDKGNSHLGKCPRVVLSVLAQHPEGCDKRKLTLLAGYSWNSTFSNVLGALRTDGYIEGRNQETIRITTAGLNALGNYTPLPEGQALRDYWLGKFGKCPRAVLTALFDHPSGFDKTTLCELAGYSWNSTFSNVLGKLRTAGLIYGRNNETIKPSEHLFK